jgi:hypothetical protein
MCVFNPLTLCVTSEREKKRRVACARPCASCCSDLRPQPSMSQAALVVTLYRALMRQVDAVSRLIGPQALLGIRPPIDAHNGSFNANALAGLGVWVGGCVRACVRACAPRSVSRSGCVRGAPPPPPTHTHTPNTHTHVPASAPTPGYQYTTLDHLVHGLEVLPQQLPLSLPALKALIRCAAARRAWRRARVVFRPEQRRARQHAWVWCVARLHTPAHACTRLHTPPPCRVCCHAPGRQAKLQGQQV